MRIRKIIKDCLAKEQLDIIVIGLTFGELFASENDGENSAKQNRFIEEMLEQFESKDDAKFSEEKHLAVCYKLKLQ